MDNFEKILNISIVDTNIRKELNEAVFKYNRSMIIFRKKDADYTPEELLEFKCLSNSFCTINAKIYGRKIFTNYFHMLIANHMHDYMVEWGNLHTYSQQGQESLNSLIKSFFFRRTNKSEGKNNMKRTRLKLIMRLLQRRILWISGIANKILDKYSKDKSFNLNDLLPDINLILVSNADNEHGDDICVHDQLYLLHKLCF